MRNHKLKYIDLFAGCGGLSLGMYNTGLWKGIFAVEKSPDAFSTLQYNLIDKHDHFQWPDWLPQKEHDINEVIKDFTPELKKLNGSIDLIAGGPPCQGFSTAGRRIENDNRNKLINSYVKFVRLVQPKIIFFENVKGFTQKFDKNKINGRIYSEYVKKLLKRSSTKMNYHGYDVYGTLIDFSEYGIPQKRTRFILFGIRKDLSNICKPYDFFTLLNKKKQQFLVNKGIGLTNSLKDAISDLLKKREVISPDSKLFLSSLYNKPKTPYQRLLKSSFMSPIPDSHRFARHSAETITKYKYILATAEKNKTISKDIKTKYKIKKRTLIPLSPDLPTPTITTLPDDYLHYCEYRILTVREYARIQSFNDWYEFKGKYTTGGKARKKEVPRYSQIGNAIPPLFAEHSGNVLGGVLYE